MAREVEFAKLSGSGNDFVCLDNRAGEFAELLAAPARVAHFARTLCRDGMGIGADGVIFACRPGAESPADIAAAFYEADGSQAELCGNGIACLTHWVLAHGWLKSGEIFIDTAAGIVRGAPRDGLYVRVCIPSPRDVQMGVPLTVFGQSWEGDYAVTGVPHLLVYVDDLEKFEVSHWGPAFRHHPHFQPRGVNANFVQVLREGELAIRTFEFGVEDETLSCGTGSATAAILAARRFKWDRKYLSGQHPVLVRARSGDQLRIYFEQQSGGRIEDVCLETVVRFVFTGRLHPVLAEAAWNGQAVAPQRPGQ